MQEVWTPVRGLEELYEVSNLGQIRTTYGLVFKPFLNNKGYLATRFQVNNQVFNWLVHRLVAEHFVPNPHSYPCVDHLDSNRQNNAYTNLEWVTHKENMKRASERGSFKSQKNTLGIKYSTSTSKYYGVSFDKSRNAWMGRIVIDRKYVSQKRFKTEIEAAKFINQVLDELNSDRPRNII